MSKGRHGKNRKERRRKVREQAEKPFSVKVTQEDIDTAEAVRQGKMACPKLDIPVYNRQGGVEKLSFSPLYWAMNRKFRDLGVEKIIFDLDTEETHVVQKSKPNYGAIMELMRPDVIRMRDDEIAKMTHDELVREAYLACVPGDNDDDIRQALREDMEWAWGVIGGYFTFDSKSNRGQPMQLCLTEFSKNWVSCVQVRIGEKYTFFSDGVEITRMLTPSGLFAALCVYARTKNNEAFTPWLGSVVFESVKE